MKNNTEQQPAIKSWKLICALIILGVIGVILIVFIDFAVIARINNLIKRELVHEKAIKLGIFNASPGIEERHVWITENAQGAGKDGDIPVHIMFRDNSNFVWQLRGTGTKLRARPNCVLTAYHLFGGEPGQYGCRQIGPKEFTGAEKIVPIVSCEYLTNADDAILCAIDENRLDAPTLTVPKSTNISFWWDLTGRHGKIWPAKIHLLTYPEKEIQNLFFGEVRPGVFYFWLNSTVVPGESGTGTFIEGGKPGVYLVIIGTQPIPRGIFEQLSAEDKKAMDWSKDKLYGVGNLVFIDPKAP